MKLGTVQQVYIHIGDVLLCASDRERGRVSECGGMYRPWRTPAATAAESCFVGAEEYCDLPFSFFLPFFLTSTTRSRRRCRHKRAKYTTRRRRWNKVGARGWTPTEP